MTSTPEQERAAVVAKGLTKAQREALLALTAEPQPGPDFADDVIQHLASFREGGLVKRELADYCEAEFITDGPLEWSGRVSACWWFNLTPFGLAVREHLRDGGGRMTADEERAAIVAWLQAAVPANYKTRETSHVIGAIAAQIEAGEHLSEARAHRQVGE